MKTTIIIRKFLVYGRKIVIFYKKPNIFLTNRVIRGFKEQNLLPDRLFARNISRMELKNITFALSYEIVII
ncbi:hypothetical protein BN938_3021 [Mucinivorans hirudinis]|uniref:Uncharacterized protein n=1 Tax=Mucinivorans hirudinis TaxID=1433126 RepID=A0A060REH1_9BACT|nr:hypothetical protein BN938_3021 [Mucinivorans hirudinis]